MIFEIKQKKSVKYEKVLNKSIKELGDFYGINWIKNKPKLFILPNTKTANLLFQREVPSWSVGWKWNNNGVCILDLAEIKKGNKKWNDQRYSELIKHELSHAFYSVLSGSKSGPKWLWEGVALYTESNKRRISNLKEYKFHTFLRFYEKHKIKNISVYNEAGSVVAVLVERFGKARLLKLIKKLKELSGSRKDFDVIFKGIYGFKPSYKDFNKLLNK